MNIFLKTILGSERSAGEVGGGDSRLELTALPRGAEGVALVLGAIFLLALIWRLYRGERRGLSRPRRVVLVGLRVLPLLALAAMLAEPVLVSSRHETVPSHLAIVLDDSESLGFSDPYTDDSRAAELAARLRLQSDGARSPVDRLRETPRLDLVKRLLRPQLEALGRGRELALYDLETASRGGAGAVEPGRVLGALKPDRAVSPLGGALGGVVGA